MERSEQVGELITALAKARKKFAPIEKDAINPAFKSKYAPIENIIEATYPALTEHGLVIIEEEVPSVKDNHLGWQDTMYHTSGQYVSVRGDFPLIGNGTIHNNVGTRTYARRSVLSAMLNVAGDDDVDGNTPEQQGNHAPQRTQAPQKVTSRQTEVSAKQVPTPKPVASEQKKRAMQVWSELGLPLNKETLPVGAAILGKKIWEVPSTTDEEWAKLADFPSTDNMENRIVMQELFAGHWKGWHEGVEPEANHVFIGKQTGLNILEPTEFALTDWIALYKFSQQRKEKAEQEAIEQGEEA